jgi:hypothetical protein
MPSNPSVFSPLLAVFLQEWQALATLTLRLLAWLTQVRSPGMYEILRYDATLELLDTEGRVAHFRKRQQVRFLQDHILAFQDYAWGDGDIFAGYSCSPGVAVDRYQEGDRWNILISLRETKSRGDVTDFYIERTITDGFIQAEEWYQAEIRHATRSLRLAVIFPATRPCRHATLHTRRQHRTFMLGPGHLQTLPDGRQIVSWETTCVRELEVYTLRWVW